MAEKMNPLPQRKRPFNVSIKFASCLTFAFFLWPEHRTKCPLIPWPPSADGTEIFQVAQRQQLLERPSFIFRHQSGLPLRSICTAPAGRGGQLLLLLHDCHGFLHDRRHQYIHRLIPKRPLSVDQPQGSPREQTSALEGFFGTREGFPHPCPHRRLASTVAIRTEWAPGATIVTARRHSTSIDDWVSLPRLTNGENE